jgi:hypothetical protein
MKALACVGIIAIAAACGYVAGRRTIDSTTSVVLDTLLEQNARLDTVYATDTIRLWRAKMVYDTARITDTLMRNDTVFIPRMVADSAVAACYATVATCETRVGISDSIAGFWRDSVHRTPPPTKVSRIVGLTAIVILVIQALAR